MGKALSRLRRPQPRESETAMELRKRPRPPRVDPDYVASSPLPSLKRQRRQVAPATVKKLRKGATPAAAQPSRPAPSKRARCAPVGVGSPIAGLQPGKRGRPAASLSPCTSPFFSFLARHPFNCYEPDLWTEVSKYLDGRDLVQLSLADRWFHRLLADNSIWRHVFLRDLYLLFAYPNPPRPLSFSWRLLYSSAFDGTHSYCFRQPEKHIDWLRIGGFFLDSPFVLLTGMLGLPRWMPPVAEGVELAIEMAGACLLTNARPGIWIADLHLVRCPVCNINSCEGTMQVLDARHVELFLEEGFKDGSWEYEDLGEHLMDMQAPAAAGAIFDAKHLSSKSTACVLNAKSWIGKPEDWQPKARIAAYSVAVNTNLQPNEGLLVRFQAMRDTTREGEIVSLRISQQLI